MSPRLAATPIVPSFSPGGGTTSVWLRSAPAFEELNDRLALEQDRIRSSGPLQSFPKRVRRTLPSAARGSRKAAAAVTRSATPARDGESPVDLPGDEQDEHGEHRERNRPRVGKRNVPAAATPSVGRVTVSAEVGVLDEARAGGREELPGEVRGEVRLSFRATVGGRAGRPDISRLPWAPVRGRVRPGRPSPSSSARGGFPNLVVVDELRKEPTEHEHERKDHQGGRITRRHMESARERQRLAHRSSMVAIDASSIAHRETR